MGWDGTDVPAGPRCLGGRGGGRGPRKAPSPASRAHLGTGEWPAAPAFASLWFPGRRPRAPKDSPSPSSRCPRGLGPKHSIPNPRISSFPERTPPPPPAPGTLGKAPGAAPASTPASKLDALWATPVPEDSPGWPAPAPRTPSPSPVTGPSQYTWMYSSKLCPEQRKVTEAARVGFRKADVRGPAAEQCRRQSWPACATSPLDPPTHLGGPAPPPVPTGTRGGGRPAQARGQGSGSSQTGVSPDLSPLRGLDSPAFLCTPYTRGRAS